MFGLLAFLVIAFVISAVRRGWNGVFTLMAVMAILMVLGAMLLPVLASAKRRAQRINTISNLKQVGLAIRIYEGDNNNRLPASFEDMTNELGTERITYDVETGQRFTYLGAGLSEDSLNPESVIAYSPIVNGGCNVLFADGSVSEISAEHFQELSQRGLILTVGPNQTSQAQNEAVSRAEIPSPQPVMAPPPSTMGGVYAINQAIPASAAPSIPPENNDMSVVPPPVVAGIHSIRIELPQSGQPFLFTKVLNIRDEPLSIHAHVMPLSVYQTFQMIWQTAAFLVGLVVWWVQWRRANRNTFILTVALALIIGSVCSLLVQCLA